MRIQRPPRKRGILLGAAMSIVVVVLLFAGLYWVDKTEEKPETRGDLQARYTDELISLYGQTYRLKPNLTSILLLGIDRAAPEEEDGDFHSGGNADFLRLLVIDPGDKTVAQLQIDRDTIAEVATLNLIGQRTDTRPIQIALSHSYGDGRKMSCQLTVEAVSRLLLNAPIQHYAALNLDGIAALNDFVGGVTVLVTDDFSGVDPALQPGAAVRLTGKQAETFLRSRTQLPISTNEARMARQQTYLAALTEIIGEQLKNDPEYIGKLFDAVLPYLTSSMTRTQMVNTAYRARDYQRTPLIEIPGSRGVSASGYMEFFADEAALEQIVLHLFYQEAHTWGSNKR